jgi:hypothetical protein
MSWLVLIRCPAFLILACSMTTAPGCSSKLEKLPRNRVLVSITIDEIQYLSMEYLAALIVDLHRVSHEQLPFMVERMERIGDLGDICWLNAQ